MLWNLLTIITCTCSVLPLVPFDPCYDASTSLSTCLLMRRRVLYMPGLVPSSMLSTMRLPLNPSRSEMDYMMSWMLMRLLPFPFPFPLLPTGERLED